MKRRWVLGGLIGTAFGAAGCSVFPEQPYLHRRDWPLAVTRPTTEPPRRGGRILLVRTILAGPGLEARGLRTLQPDGSMQAAFYEQWIVPPAEAVDDDLRRWLDASGLFSVVLAPGSRLSADLALEGELTALNADVVTNTARAALSIVLIDNHPNPARLLLQKSLTATVPLPAKDIPAQAHAQVLALTDVLRQAEAAIATAIGA